mmetsp:Transcript_26512/g.30825  ORF Transcript_26512/g.30825 Transcript_26512/m.30825 type:complete len:317 (-) Transcript_26512:42-992(-)
MYINVKQDKSTDRKLKMQRQSSFYGNIPTVDSASGSFPSTQDEDCDEEVPKLQMSFDFDSLDESSKQIGRCNSKFDKGYISDDDISYDSDMSEGNDFDLFHSTTMLSSLLDDDFLTEDCFSDDSSIEDDLSSNVSKEKEEKQFCRRVQTRSFKSHSEPTILTQTFSLNTIVEEGSDYEEESSLPDCTSKFKSQHKIATTIVHSPPVRSKSDSDILTQSIDLPSNLSNQAQKGKELMFHSSEPSSFEKIQEKLQSNDTEEEDKEQDEIANNRISLHYKLWLQSKDYFPQWSITIKALSLPCLIIPFAMAGWLCKRKH